MFDNKSEETNRNNANEKTVPLENIQKINEISVTTKESKNSGANGSFLAVLGVECCVACYTFKTMCI